jgi:Flp pilus assembly protein TadD
MSKATTKKQSSTPSQPEEKESFGKRFLAWSSLVLSIIGGTLGALAFFNNQGIQSRTDALEAQSLLDQAWDHLGGVEGSNEITSEQLTNQSVIELEKAERKISRAKQLAPELAKVYSTEASLAYARKQLDESLRLCRRALELDPNASITYNKIGIVLTAQGKFTEAVKEFEQAHLLDKNDASPLSNLCYVYFRLGRLEEAAEKGEEALRVDPRWEQTYDNLGTVREAQGRTAEAEALRNRNRIEPGRESRPQ